MSISLENIVKTAMVNSVTALLVTARIQFFTQNTTAMLTYATNSALGASMLAGTGLICSTAAMGAAVNGVATFAAITSATVSTAGTVLAYAVIKNNSATPVGNDVAWFGSVAQTTADMTFNTTVWAGGDNISISALTFTQP